MSIVKYKLSTRSQVMLSEGGGIVQEKRWVGSGNAFLEETATKVLEQSTVSFKIWEKIEETTKKQ